MKLLFSILISFIILPACSPNLEREKAIKVKNTPAKINILQYPSLFEKLKEREKWDWQDTSASPPMFIANGAIMNDMDNSRIMIGFQDDDDTESELENYRIVNCSNGTEIKSVNGNVWDLTDNSGNPVPCDSIYCYEVEIKVTDLNSNQFTYYSEVDDIYVGCCYDQSVFSGLTLNSQIDMETFVIDPVQISSKACN